MFELGKSKKKGTVEEWNFDLENDLKNPTSLKKTKEQVEQRVQSLKGLLRSGGDKKTFDDAQALLHGYLAVQKVIGRVGR